MQLARQERRRRSSQRSPRDRTIAAIHITWKKIRPDLGDADESREQRLTFMAGVLNLKRDISSTRDLTDKQLGRVLDRMRELEKQPGLPGTRVIHASTQHSSTEGSAETEIIHLATGAQVATIEKLFEWLGWSANAREGFLRKRFKRSSQRMISPAQANSLTMILLNIGAAKAIRQRTGATRVSRAMIRAEIPQLKRQLGIDQKPQHIEEEFLDDEHEA